MVRSRGDKANRDKFFSILAESKFLLRVLIPAVQEMPRAERYDGIGAEMKKAAIGILREFSIAYKCYDPADKKRHIEEMIGYYYTLMALLDIACTNGLLKERHKLGIAERMYRIEEGIGKWYSSLRQNLGQSTEDKAPSGDAGGGLS